MNREIKIENIEKQINCLEQYVESICTTEGVREHLLGNIIISLIEAVYFVKTLLTAHSRSCNTILTADVHNGGLRFSIHAEVSNTIHSLLTKQELILEIEKNKSLQLIDSLTDTFYVDEDEEKMNLVFNLEKGGIQSHAQKETFLKEYFKGEGIANKSKA
jgi:hypothetical protein